MGAALVASPAAATTVVHCPTDNLQTAITAAPAGSTIQIQGTCTGNFIINPNQVLTLVGGTLDGNNSGGQRGMVLFVNPGARATLDSITIQHGFVQDNDGGGILNDGTLTLNSSRVSNNTVIGALTLTGNGGGIANFGTLNINSSSVSNNTATSVGRFTGGGGGIFNGGTLNITSSSVDKNSALNGILVSFGGGGILNAFHGTIHLVSSSVSANVSDREGGGIRNFNGTVTLTSSIVTANVSSGSGGGIANGDTVTLLASLVFSNTPDNCAPLNSIPGCTN
jgi:hypothetical protein